MDKDKILLLTKCAIAIMLVVTVCILALRNGESAETFKLIVVSAMSYMFGQRNGGDGNANNAPAPSDK